MSNIVFALDIGTQSVTGILLHHQDGQYHVIDYCTEQHVERTMLDGQIQDVIKVAEVIQKVKNKLEENHGPLTEVCVAAAGRALKTVKMEKKLSISHQPLSSEEAVRHLELSAVQQAQLELVKGKEQEMSHYHCVGYSVLHYYLDGEQIGSLIDQSGREASVEVITTFLPKVVIESLLAALERADLKMKALTLEPIAAIHVLIPSSMRRLNVTLIDIGAGTSDIAITSDSTVSAYGMVPMAGDEVTETISDAYLLDFKEAERTKQRVVNEDSAQVQDILGFEVDVTYDALEEQIAERTEELAQLLSKEVLQLNGAKAPQAVMLIGGGSLTPKIAEKLATSLNLPSNRVAIRGVDGISLLSKENQDMLPSGPDFVTPIGIAISATENPLHYISVYVNDRLTLMFQTNELTVGDCLVQAGININTYYGKIGLSRIADINGTPTTLRGTYGEAPYIYVNNEKATVQQKVQAESNITIHKGADGKEPHVSIKELLGETNEEVHFTFEGLDEVIQSSYLVNGSAVNSDYIIQDKDKVEYHLPRTIDSFLNNKYPKMLQEKQETIQITIDEQDFELDAGKLAFFINGEQTNASTTIKTGDVITKKHIEPITTESLLTKLDKSIDQTIKVTFNETPVILSQNQTTVYRGETKLDKKAEIHDGDILTTKEAIRPSFVFQDIFRYVDIKLATQGSYRLTINDQQASFNDPIQDGDKLAMRWE